MLRHESEAASTLQSTVKSLESDKAQLQERVRTLEKSLTAAQTLTPAAQASSSVDIPTGKHVTCLFKKKKSIPSIKLFFYKLMKNCFVTSISYLNII